MTSLATHTQKKLPATDIYCLTSEEHSKGRDNVDIVKQLIQADIKIIQFREKEKHMGEKYEQCLKIRGLTKEAGVFFIVNDNVDLAMLVGADGIHIGQEDLPIEAVRQLVGNDMVIGLSTHSKNQAEDAVKRGADYIGVGPIFQTHTKKDVCDPVGYTYLDHVVSKKINIPFVAIGGIKAHNVGEVVNHGASCVAMVTEIVGADDIGKKIKEVRQIMATSK